MVALSFVSGPEDAREAREIIAESGQNVPLLAKIERPQALERLDAMLRAFDGVMVARGDLAIEVSAEVVPVAQKRIIERGELLRQARHHRHADARLHDPQPLAHARRGLGRRERGARRHGRGDAQRRDGGRPLPGARRWRRWTASSARRRPCRCRPLSTRRCGIVARTRTRSATPPSRSSATSKPSALAAHTRSGRTAQILSKLRPPSPIFALTEREPIARQLALWRGVVPLVIKRRNRGEEMFSCIARELGARQRRRRRRDRGRRRHGAAGPARPHQLHPPPARQRRPARQDTNLRARNLSGRCSPLHTSSDLADYSRWRLPR